MPVVTQVGGLTGGAIKEQIFILVMYTFGVGTSMIAFYNLASSESNVGCLILLF